MKRNHHPEGALTEQAFSEQHLPVLVPILLRQNEQQASRIEADTDVLNSTYTRTAAMRGFARCIVSAVIRHTVAAL